ncbi:MAG TPA: hypothetical protein VF081_07590 [Solirubrobacterales bacterium]
MTPGEAGSLRAGLRWVIPLLFGALVLTGAGHPAAASAGPLYTGVTNVGSNEQLAFDRTRAAGATFVRLPLTWADVAPKAQPASWNAEDPADPNYSWKDVDIEVVRAAQAGLIPVLQVDGAPRWAQRCQTPSALPDAICDPDPAALGAFATAAARRYSGKFGGLPRVQYWQGLNEPNLSLFFFPQFDTESHALSPGLYRKLINSFYAGVKAVSSANLVLAAGLGPIAVKSWTIGPMRFARSLLCMAGARKPHPIKGDCEGGVHFDIFAIQPYTTGGPTHEGGINDVELGDLPKLQALLRAADRAHRIKGHFRHTPLWITEFSWDSQPPDPGGLPMDILTHWTAEALYTVWRDGIDHFFWYSLRDSLHQPGSSYADSLESGLYLRGGPDVEQDQPKEVLYAFRFPFVSFPRQKGLFFWGRTPTSTPGKVSIQVLDGNRWRNVSVSRADKNGIFVGTAPSHYGRDRTGYVRAFYRGQSSLPFSMKPVPDFRHPPFG